MTTQFINPIKLIEAQEPIDLTDIKDIVRQKFVGIIAIENKVYQIYPKYYDQKKMTEDKNNLQFKLIIDSIHKYKKKHKYQIYESQDLQDQSSNIITLIVEIFNHFEAYGLYRVFEDILVQNGLNEIHWERTINTQEVFWINQAGSLAPIYPNVITRHRKVVQDCEFMNLHILILNMCNKILIDCGLDAHKRDFDVVEIDQDNISLSLLEDQNSPYREELIYKINQEKSRQFIEYKQKTLDLMLAFIKETYAYSSDKCVVYGTNSFHTVWESMLKDVFNDDSDGLKDQVMSKPKWMRQNQYAVDQNTTSSSDEDSKLKHSGIPDIIKVSRDQKSLYLFDAKYYQMIEQENPYAIKGQPGIGDIVKQYFYMLSVLPKYEKLKNISIQHIGNFFIVPKLPSDGGEDLLVQTSKQLSVDLFDNDLFNFLFPNQDCNTSKNKLKAIFSSIHVLEINPNVLMKHYLENLKNQTIDVFNLNLPSQPI
jgi:hypothetical protein